MYIYLNLYTSSRHPLNVSGAATGKRKRVTRKADGKLTCLGNLGGPGTKS